MEVNLVVLVVTCLLSFVTGWIISRLFSASSTSSEKKSTKEQNQAQKDKKQEESESDDDESDSDEEEEYKMVLGVRLDLKMAKGKVAAQCCHACLSAYKVALRTTPDAVKTWSRSGQKKIAVSLPDKAAM